MSDKKLDQAHLARTLDALRKTDSWSRGVGKFIGGLPAISGADAQGKPVKSFEIEMVEGEPRIRVSKQAQAELAFAPAQPDGPNPYIGMELSMALLDNIRMDPKVADWITMGVLSRVHKEMPQTSMVTLQQAIMDTFPLVMQMLDEQQNVIGLFYDSQVDPAEIALQATMVWHAVLRKNLMEKGVTLGSAVAGPALIDTEILKQYNDYFSSGPA